MGFLLSAPDPQLGQLERVPQLSNFELVLAAGAVEGEKERLLSVRTVGTLMFFSVLIAMRPKRAFPAFLFPGGEEEVGGEFAGDHDAGSCSVKPSFTTILLYHSI